MHKLKIYKYSTLVVAIILAAYLINSIKFSIDEEARISNAEEKIINNVFPDISDVVRADERDSFKYKFQYETSLLGEALGSRYDQLRDYHDYNLGMGGSLPFYNKIKLYSIKKRL